METVKIGAGDVATVSAETLVGKAKATRAERLNGLLLKFLPHRAKEIASGAWGKDGAPYEFTSNDDGTQRLTIEDKVTGDRIGVIGKDRDDVLDKLDARLSK